MVIFFEIRYYQYSYALKTRKLQSQALAYPNVSLLNLTPEIAVEATQLPQPFHRDPADQIIVATARIHQCHLMTANEKICNYSHVNLLP